MKNISKKITALILSLILAAAVIPLSGINLEAGAASGSDIVAYAKAFIGYPYVAGGKGPDSFDCSGFVSYVFGHFGINIPNSTKTLWDSKETYGTVIGHGSTDKAQAGDLILWVDHVSIYTSDGNCVEALNSKYGVTTSMPVNSHINGLDYYVLRVKGLSGSSAAPAAPVVTLDKNSVKLSEKVTLSWKPVDGALHYRVECILLSLPYASEIVYSTSHSVTFPLNGTYTVYVYAVNASGETRSDKINVTVSSDGTSTGGTSPAAVALSALNSGSVKDILNVVINVFKAFIQFITNIIGMFTKTA